MRKAGSVISGMAVIGSVAWYYFEPGFEPVITSLAGIGGLLYSFSSEKKLESNYAREFEALKARWNAEREIEPASLEDARWLLGEVLDFIFNFRAHENTDKYHSKIDELGQRIKRTQNTQISIDGGKSYAKFWTEGTDEINEFSDIIKKI